MKADVWKSEAEREAFARRMRRVAFRARMLASVRRVRGQR